MCNLAACSQHRSLVGHRNNADLLLYIAALFSREMAFVICSFKA